MCLHYVTIMCPGHCIYIEAIKADQVMNKDKVHDMVHDTLCTPCFAGRKVLHFSFFLYTIHDLLQKKVAILVDWVNNGGKCGKRGNRDALTRP